MNHCGRAVGALVLAFAPLVSAVAAADLPLRADRLPPDVKGLWAYEASDCAHPGSDGLLTIEDRSIQFFASAYEVTRVLRRGDGALRASGLRSDEGEAGRTRDAVDLKLIAPDRLHVIGNDPAGHVYHRCKHAPR